jgi:transglutaminase-like putative cysteine protease
MENQVDIGVIVPHFMIMRDPRIVPFIDRMWAKSGNDETKFIESFFNFVTENIFYCTDKDCFGQEEYVQMPFETLESGYGDCECSSMLFISGLFLKSIPSRVTFGYAVGQSHRWAEVFYKGKWMVFDTTNGDIFPVEKKAEKGYDALFYVTPFSFALAKLPILPPLFLP